MKLRNLLFSSLAALSFTACSSDDSIEQGKNSSEHGDAYASFTVNLGDHIFTRSGGSEKVDYGTAEEQKINGVRVVMYANGRVEKSQDFAISSTGDQLSGDLATSGVNTPKKFATKAIDVKKQNYQVAVILNATSDIIEKTKEGSLFAELETALENVKPTDFKDKGFVMSNSQGVVNLLASELKSSKEDAEKSPLNVQVDRVLAKVIVETNDNLSSDVALVDARGWILDVENKSTYVMRHLAPAQDGSYEVVDHKNPAINSTPRAYRYAKDPNFNPIDLSGKKSYNERLDLLGKYFNYYTLETFDDGNKVNKDFDYVIENTFDGGKENVLQSQATRVVLKAGYTPKSLSISNTDDWVSYAGIAMAEKDFHNNVVKALMLDWNESVEGLTPSFTNEIKNMVFLSAYIQGLEAKSEKPEFVEKYKHLDIVKFKDLEALQAIVEKTSTEDGKIASVKLTQDEITSIGIEFKVGGDNKAFSISNLNYYKGGDNYYPLYIKHFKYDAGNKNAYGKYGVVRNNFYKVKVDAINRPGTPVIIPPVGPGLPTVPTTPVDPKDPTPVDPDPETPEKPIDSDEIWVSYEVEILPWLVREQIEFIN